VPSIEAKVQSSFKRGLSSIFASIVAPTLPVPCTKETWSARHSLGSPSDVVKYWRAGVAREFKRARVLRFKHDAVTNAHVVAVRRFSRQWHTRFSGALRPSYDIAILRVGSVHESPLIFLPRVAAAELVRWSLDFRSTRLEPRPGYIEGNVTAQGRDIYDQRLSRDYEVLESDVNPGNSGSPVLVGGEWRLSLNQSR